MTNLDLVDVPEIAIQLKVDLRSAWRYVSRSDFPHPVFAGSRKRLWDRGDVERWAAVTLPLPRDPRRGPRTRDNG